MKTYEAFALIAIIYLAPHMPRKTAIFVSIIFAILSVYIHEYA